MRAALGSRKLPEVLGSQWRSRSSADYPVGAFVPPQALAPTSSHQCRQRPEHQTADRVQSATDEPSNLGPESTHVGSGSKPSTLGLPGRPLRFYLDLLRPPI